MSLPGAGGTGTGTGLPPRPLKIWFVCRTCIRYFSSVDRFIKHKEENHFEEFRKLECIVFEDTMRRKCAPALDPDDIQNQNLLAASSSSESSSFPHSASPKPKPIPKPEPNIAIDPHPHVGIDLHIKTEPIGQEEAILPSSFNVSSNNSGHHLNSGNFNSDNEQDPFGNLNGEPMEEDEDDGSKKNEDFSFRDTNNIEPIFIPKTEWVTYDIETETETDNDHHGDDEVDEVDPLANVKSELVEFQGEGVASPSTKSASSTNTSNKINHSAINSTTSRSLTTTKATATRQKQSNPRVTRIVLKCKLCPNYFTGLTELAKHLEESHKTKQIEISRPKPNSNSNSESTSKPKPNPKPNKPSFTCSICKSGFIEERLLALHLMTHPEISGQFKCPYLKCSKSYPLKDSLRYHLEAHANARKFKCAFPSCSEAFKTKRDLKGHITGIHGGTVNPAEIPVVYGCHICGSEFETKSSLKNHTAFHSTGRRGQLFKCLHGGCTSAYRFKADLITHRKLHGHSHYNNSSLLN